MSSNATEHILIEGWLEKKSAKSDGTKHVLHLPSLWQKRYCVLGKFLINFILFCFMSMTIEHNVLIIFISVNYTDSNLFVILLFLCIIIFLSSFLFLFIVVVFIYIVSKIVFVDIYQPHLKNINTKPPIQFHLSSFSKNTKTSLRG